MVWALFTLLGCPVITDAEVAQVQDSDGDGFLAERFGGADCDDEDAAIHPDAPEVWYDGVDGNCDGRDDFDQDGDGVRAADSDDDSDDDCDDTDPDIGAPAVLRHRDGDGDGFGAGDAVAVCPQWAGYVDDDTDCNDSNPAVNPAAEEVWYNAVDEDCDDRDDDRDRDGLSFADDCDDDDAEVAGPTAYTFDADGDGYAAEGNPTRDACEAPAGYVDQLGDCDDGDAARSPGQQEVCDASDVDEDCDGLADDDDDDVVGPFIDAWPDLDGDGWGADGPSTPRCDADDGWADIDGDCLDDPADAMAFAAEDLHPETEWYVDADGDGFGDPERFTGRITCEEQPFLSPNDDDCNDGDPASHPGATDPITVIDDDPGLTRMADEDCARDSDFGRVVDDDGIQWPAPLSDNLPHLPACAGGTVWFVDDDAVVPANPKIGFTGTEDDPFPEIQDAVEASSPCDRIQVHEGFYDPFFVYKPLVVAGYPDEDVVVRGVPADEVGMELGADDIVISNMTIRGFDSGVLIAGEVLMEWVTFEDVVSAVQVDTFDAYFFGIRIERADRLFQVFGSPTVRIAEATFDGNEGIFGIVTADGLPDLHLYRTRFADNGFLRGAINASARDLYVRDLTYESNSGGLLEAVNLRRLDLHEVDIRGGLALEGMVVAWGSLDSPGVATIDGMRVTDMVVATNPYLPAALQIVRGGAVQMTFFETNDVRRLEMQGNEHLGAGPMLSVFASDNYGALPGGTTISNVLLSGPANVGMSVVEAEVHNVTIVGTTAAIQSVSSIQRPQGPTRVYDSILWDNVDVERRSQPGEDFAYFGMVSGDVEVYDSLLSSIPFNIGNDCVRCDTSPDPGFLRYHPNLDPSVRDLTLAPDSPWLSPDPIPEASWPCTTGADAAFDDAALVAQIGAFGNRGLPDDGVSGADPGRYNSCWPEGAPSTPVMYDVWRTEHVAHLPDEDEDTDGLDNLTEFMMGTLPDADDTDGDDALDDEDADPLDPTVQ